MNRKPTYNNNNNKPQHHFVLVSNTETGKGALHVSSPRPRFYMHELNRIATINMQDIYFFLLSIALETQNKKDSKESKAGSQTGDHNTTITTTGILKLYVCVCVRACVHVLQAHKCLPGFCCGS